MLGQENVDQIKPLAYLDTSEGMCDPCIELGLGMCRGKGAASYAEEVFIRDEKWWKEIIDSCARPEVVDFLRKIIDSN